MRFPDLPKTFDVQWSFTFIASLAAMFVLCEAEDGGLVAIARSRRRMAGKYKK